MGWIPGSDKDFSRHHVQTSSGAYSTSYLMVTAGSLTGIYRQQGCEADHSPPPSADVNNVWSYTSTTPYPSVA
jgi:hypothetical protein